MKIKKAEFIRGLTGTTDITEDKKPCVAFCGRSNVGKSSILNALTKRNNLAHSSSTPGKTTEINYFLINDSFYFVDLPGYGYAKRSLKQREKIRKMILWYLFRSQANVVLYLILFDSKIGPTEYELELYDLLKEANKNILLLGTKEDKAKPAMKRKYKHILKDTNHFFVSVKKEGKLERLRQLIGNEVYKAKS
jgi:GTP-binding protein